jgi:hypothetical protein
MDPVTASMNAITAFFDFLVSPVGQIVAQEMITFDAALASKMHDLFELIHRKLTV